MPQYAHSGSGGWSPSLRRGIYTEYGSASVGTVAASNMLGF